MTDPVRLYDPDEVLEEILQADPLYRSASLINPDVSRDDTWRTSDSRVTELDLILKADAGPMRQLVAARQETIDAIDDIIRIAPHAEKAIQIVSDNSLLSAKTGTPLRIPPLLLSGPPGAGKTWLASAFAKALNIECNFIHMATLADSSDLTGRSKVWREPQSGKIARALLSSHNATRMFVLDEVEKMRPYQGGSQLDAFHTLWEEDTAARFVDDFLGFSMRADHIQWVMTANEPERLSESLLDRLIHIEIEKPDHEAMRIIVSSIYNKENGKIASTFSPIDNEVADILISKGLRQIRRLLPLAFAAAFKENRHRLQRNDIETASRMTAAKAKPRIGFTS